MSHNCKALIVTCMDFRFQTIFRKFAEDNNLIDNYDLFSIAGTQKTFLDEETRQVAMKQVELSKTLHGMTDVYLIAHWDCGAYGGNAALGGGEEEVQRYKSDLEKAEQMIKEKYPDLTVHKLLVMPEGESQEMKFIQY